MKNRIVIMAMAIALGMASCTDKKSTETTVEENVTVETDATATPADTTAAVPVDTTATEALVEEGKTISVKGEVTEITRGKDGYMAKIKDKDGKSYTVTVSIVNLKDPKQFKQVEKGQTIEATGETFSLGTDTGVKATAFKVE